MEKSLTAIYNEKISNQLKTALIGSKRLMKDLCAQEDGYIDIFIRNGDIAQLSYKKMQVDSTSLDFDSMDDEEDFSKAKVFEVIPADIYRRFAYILASTVYYSPVMEHGHLCFKFKFTKSGDQWQEKFTMEFHEEIPFRNGAMMAKYQ